MFEVSLAVVEADGMQRVLHAVDQGVKCSGGRFPQARLDLRPHVLDRIQIRRIRWQVDELASGILNRLGDPLLL